MGMMMGGHGHHSLAPSHEIVALCGVFKKLNVMMWCLEDSNLQASSWQTHISCIVCIVIMWVGLGGEFYVNLCIQVL